MGRIKELIMEIEEKGYDVEELSLEEMLQIQTYGKLKCTTREPQEGEWIEYEKEPQKLSKEEEEWLEYEAEKESYLRATTNYGVRLHEEF